MLLVVHAQGELTRIDTIQLLEQERHGIIAPTYFSLKRELAKQ